MEQGHFDAITRRVNVGGARRAVLRALAAALLSGALVGDVADHGLVRFAQAKKGGKRQSRHSGDLHDEKRRRKKKRRKKGQEPQTCGDGERSCEDGTCVSHGFCCSDERSCDDGSCVAGSQCCPGAIPPPCGDCQEVVCEDGALICRSTCQSGGVTCCNGTCLDPCPVGQERNPYSCQCECPSGSELLADGETCCAYKQACNANETGYATTCCAGGNFCVGGNYCS